MVAKRSASSSSMWRSSGRREPSRSKTSATAAHMSKIAISYRRSDSTVIAGRIADRLAVRYGKDSVFIDVNSVPLGTEFRKYIQDAWSHIDILLVVIGPQWLGGEASTARIKHSEDMVRIEVETALKRAMPVIPVLVGGATMPAADQLPPSLRTLRERNAAEVDGGRDFHPHMDRLIKAIDLLVPSDTQARTTNLGCSSVPDHTRGTPTSSGLDGVLALAGAMAITVCALLVAHHLLINMLDLGTIDLRVAAFLIPFVFSVVCFRQTRWGWLAAMISSGLVALIAVAGMSASTALNSGQPILPGTRYEWRELAEYFVSIAISFLAGYIVANLLSVTPSKWGRKS